MAWILRMDQGNRWKLKIHHQLYVLLKLEMQTHDPFMPIGSVVEETAAPETSDKVAEEPPFESFFFTVQN